LAEHYSTVNGGEHHYQAVGNDINKYYTPADVTSTAASGVYSFVGAVGEERPRFTLPNCGNMLGSEYGSLDSVYENDKPMDSPAEV
jgi:hypothetical protein